MNFISNGNFVSQISQTGGGYSFIGDAGYNHITRKIPGDVVIEDRPGRYIYIRDNDTGEFWSVGWQPVMKKPDRFQARHGIGYTYIESANYGIDSSVLFFVPTKDDCEIWKTQIGNSTDQKRRLSIFFFVEWSLGLQKANATEAAFNDLFNYTAFKDDAIIAGKRHWETSHQKGLYWDKVAYFALDHKVDSFDCQKDKFTGVYGDIIAPRAVVDGKCSRSQGLGHRSVGVLQKNITLGPNANINLNAIMGAVETNPESKSFNQALATGVSRSRAIINKYKRPGEVDKAFKGVKDYWKEYNSQNIVKTPEKNFDISFNYWNKYQAWVTSNWSLMDSYYVGGASSTIGFRDMSQHIIGVMPNDISFAEKQLLVLLNKQLSDGRVVHNWDKLTGLGKVTNHSDDTQWLILSSIFYIKETGDTDFLNKQVEYYDSGSGSVLEHLIRAMEHSLKHLSVRHLPYRLTADWNDAYNGEKEGKGESQMVACQMCYNLRDMQPILVQANEHHLAEKYQKMYEQMKNSINKHFWDGSWYIRGTTNNGSPVGSKKNKYQKIDINAQSWAVMAGVADEKRGKKAMDSVWKLLNTKYGPAMFLPAFQHPEEKFGIISQFAPGTKENGAIFNHPVSWAVIAETMLGRGDEAYKFWKETSFTFRGENPNVYRIEPYVYCEFVYGPEHPDFGRGSFSWATGSASWFWRGCLDNVLGVQPVVGGLKIDPCLPKVWRQVEITRKFRGAEYHIRIQNPFSVSKGVDRIIVDGVRLTGNVIRPFSGGTHFVEVTLG